MKTTTSHLKDATTYIKTQTFRIIRTIAIKHITILNTKDIRTLKKKKDKNFLSSITFSRSSWISWSVSIERTSSPSICSTFSSSIFAFLLLSATILTSLDETLIAEESTPPSFSACLSSCAMSSRLNPRALDVYVWWSVKLGQVDLGF